MLGTKASSAASSTGEGGFSPWCAILLKDKIKIELTQVKMASQYSNVSKHNDKGSIWRKPKKKLNLVRQTVTEKKSVAKITSPSRFLSLTGLPIGIGLPSPNATGIPSPSLIGIGIGVPKPSDVPKSNPESDWYPEPESNWDQFTEVEWISRLASGSGA